MTCFPSHQARCASPSLARERIRTESEALLDRLGCSPPLADSGQQAHDALATALMDAFRATRDPDVFDALVRWAGPQVRARIRARVRRLGVALDPDEIWQDTFVNVYRYPDRFVPSRPGAFAAWSSTIADNALRRLLRDLRRDASVALRDPEVLEARADTRVAEPSRHAEAREDCAVTASALQLLLHVYLASFQQLSERERFVLQMVEVQGMRYAALGERLGIRADALKMVVFRARKRVHQRISQVLAGAAPAAPSGAQSCAVA